MIIAIILASVISLVALLLFTSAGASACNVSGKLVVKAHFGFFSYKLIGRKPKQQKKKAAKKTKKPRRKPEKEPEAKQPKSLSHIGGIITVVARELNYLRTKMRLRRLKLDITIGDEDAAVTAVNYGRACAVFGMAIPVVEGLFRVGKGQINVRPDFNEKKTVVVFDVRITVRLIYLLIAGVKILLKFSEKDGRQDGKPDRSGSAVNNNGEPEKYS